MQRWSSGAPGWRQHQYDGGGGPTRAARRNNPVSCCCPATVFVFVTPLLLLRTLESA